MSEMVERVGEALRKECLQIFGSTWSNDNAWRLARTAIEAMREPTEAMTKVGNKYTDWADGADDAWDAMCDEALK